MLLVLNSLIGDKIVKVEEALKVLHNVCSVYRGTLDEHKTLQAAMQVVSDVLNKNKEVEKEEKEQGK